MKKLTTFSEANTEANRWSRKQLLRINCPLINLWNKQTVSRRNFFPWQAAKNSSWVKSKKTGKEVNKVRFKLNVFFELQSFWEKIVKPEKSRRYLVCSRKNCSVVSTSVLFEESKLNANTSSLPCSSSRWYKNSLVLNRVISTTPAKPAKSENPGTVCRSQHLCH